MLSKRFEALAEINPTDKISLRRLEEILGDDGAPLVIVFLCLPFLFPMPLPGISTIFGLGIVAFTFRVFRPGRLHLPEFMERFTLNGESVSRIGEKSLKFIRWLEKLLRPRFTLFLAQPGRILIGLAMLSSSLALAIPIPPVVPFTNTLPALAITFFALALMMRDGIAALAGHFFHIVTWVYFFSIASVAFAFAEGLVERMPQIMEWLRNLVA